METAGLYAVNFFMKRVNHFRKEVNCSRMNKSTFSVQKRLGVASKRTNEQLNSFV